MKKVTHCPAKCIGCLACTSIAPELFVPDESNGLSRLVEGKVEGENLVREVEDSKAPELLAETCPAGAITVDG